jgi:hypothetical protein
VRTSMILPPNLYRNMNETRILKNGGARHVMEANRYTSSPNGGSRTTMGIKFETVKRARRRRTAR